MGLLRKRTSKPNLKKDEPRIPTPPPQLPPLPAHIRRSESRGGYAAAPQRETRPLASGDKSTTVIGNRRRSRSLWGTSDARTSNYSWGDSTTGSSSGQRRRDSFTSSTSPSAQPWRSREAWAALHSEPKSPAVLSELTFPCAPGATPGWRGRGGGGFFGGEGEDIPPPRTPSRAESRIASRQEPVPPLPTSPALAHIQSPYRLAGRVPMPTATPSQRNEPLPASHNDRASTPTPDLGKSPSPSPETAPSVKSLVESDSAAAYAIAAGISTSSDVMSDQRSEYGSSHNHAFTSSSPLQGSSSNFGHYHQDSSPGLTASPSLTAASPHLASPGPPVVPLTPRSAAVHRMPSYDNFSSPNGGVLLAPNTSAVTSLADSRHTPWGAASRSGTPALRRENSSSTVGSHTGPSSLSASVSASQNLGSSRNGPVRLPAQSEDGHARARPEKVEHFIEHRTSLPESNYSTVSRSKNASPQPVPEVSEGAIDFSRPPTQQNSPAPGSHSSHGPPGAASGYSAANLSAKHSREPSRTPSGSSQMSATHHGTRSRIPVPVEREHGLGRPASASSNGHSYTEIPHTPNGVANAVNAWRQKNASQARRPDDGLAPNQPNGPSAARNRSRSITSSSQGHGGSSIGHSAGRKMEKLDPAAEWPPREVDQDPFTAPQHPWEAAYDAADYQDDSADYPQDVARQGVQRLPSTGRRESDRIIEPPVQMVAPGTDVMQAHAQMNARMQSGPATMPKSTQHYNRPQQQRLPSADSMSSPPMNTRSPPSGPQRLPPAPGMGSRVLSPTPSDGRSPPQAYTPFQPQMNGHPRPPRPEYSQQPKPGQMFRPPPGAAQVRPYPLQARPYTPNTQPPRSYPPQQGNYHDGYPVGPSQQPQQSQYRPTQVRPNRAPAAQVPLNQGYTAKQMSNNGPYPTLPEPQQAYPPQNQPRTVPHQHAHAHVNHHTGVSIANVPMQLPQVHKSPKVQQSVAQGGWI